jgi:membrane peptidoglycan carboxypeptidase
MLSDPKASYLRPALKMQEYNGWKTAIKTGTTNDNFDGLMTAWNTQYAVASWVGYHTRNKAMTGGSMETMTAPLTQSFMKEALNKLNTKAVNWEKPAGVKTATAYVQRTHVGLYSVEPGPAQDLFPSWYTGGSKSDSSASATIDKVSGGIATSCTPAAAKQTVGGANDNALSSDEFYPIGKTASGGSSASSASTDDVHKCDDSPPSLTLTAPSECKATDNGGRGCMITVVASAGTHPLGGGSFGGTVSLSVNGNVVSTQNVSDSPSTVTFYYAPTSSGSTSVSATVTDSVLYDSTQTATVNMTTGTTTGMIGSPNATLASQQRSSQPTTSGSGGNGNSNKQKPKKNSGRRNG